MMGYYVTLVLLLSSLHIAFSAPQYDVRRPNTATQAPFIPPANNFQQFQTEQDFPQNYANNPFLNGEITLRGLQEFQNTIPALEFAPQIAKNLPQNTPYISNSPSDYSINPFLNGEITLRGLQDFQNSIPTLNFAPQISHSLPPNAPYNIDSPPNYSNNIFLNGEFAANTGHFNRDNFNSDNNIPKDYSQNIFLNGQFAMYLPTRAPNRYPGARPEAAPNVQDLFGPASYLQNPFLNGEFSNIPKKKKNNLTAAQIHQNHQRQTDAPFILPSFLPVTVPTKDLSNNPLQLQNWTPDVSNNPFLNGEIPVKSSSQPFNCHHLTTSTYNTDINVPVTTLPTLAPIDIRNNRDTQNQSKDISNYSNNPFLNGEIKSQDVDSITDTNLNNALYENVNKDRKMLNNDKKYVNIKDLYPVPTEFPNTESVITTRFRETTFSFNEPTKPNLVTTEDNLITETLDEVTTSLTPMQTNNPAANNTITNPDDTTSNDKTTQPSPLGDRISELDTDTTPNEIMSTPKNPAATTSKPSSLMPFSQITPNSNDSPNYYDNPFLNGEITTAKTTSNPETIENLETSLSTNAQNLTTSSSERAPANTDKNTIQTTSTSVNFNDPEISEPSSTTYSPNDSINAFINDKSPSNKPKEPTTMNAASSSTNKPTNNTLTTEQDNPTTSSTSTSPNNEAGSIPGNKVDNAFTTKQEQSDTTSAPNEEPSTKTTTLSMTSSTNDTKNINSTTQKETKETTAPSNDKNKEKFTTQLPFSSTSVPNASSTTERTINNKSSTKQEPTTTVNTLTDNANDKSTTQKNTVVTTEKTPNDINKTTQKLTLSTTEETTNDISTTKKEPILTTEKTPEDNSIVKSTTPTETVSSTQKTIKNSANDKFTTLKDPTSNTTPPADTINDKSTTTMEVTFLSASSTNDESTTPDNKITTQKTPSETTLKPNEGSTVSNDKSSNNNDDGKSTTKDFKSTNNPSNGLPSTTPNNIEKNKIPSPVSQLNEEMVTDDTAPNYADNPFLNGEITTEQTNPNPPSSFPNTDITTPSGINPYLDEKNELTSSKPISDPSDNKKEQTTKSNDISSTTSKPSEDILTFEKNPFLNSEITTQKISSEKPVLSTPTTNEILNDSQNDIKPNYENNIFLNGEFSGATSTTQKESTTQNSVDRPSNPDAIKSTTKRDTTQTTTMPTTSSQIPNENSMSPEDSAQKPTTKIVTTQFLPFTTGKTTTPKPSTDSNNNNNSPIIFLPFSNGKGTTENSANPDGTNSMVPNEDTTTNSQDSTTEAITTNKTPITTLSNSDKTSLNHLTTNRNPMITTPEPILDIKFPDLNDYPPVPVPFPRPNGQLRPSTPPRQRPANLDELFSKIMRNPQVPVDPNSKPSSLEILLQLEKNRSSKLYKQLEFANLMNNQLLESNKNLVEENIMLKQKFQNTDLITRLEKECYGIKNNLSICEDEREILEENLETLNNTKNNLRTELNMCYFVQDQIRDRLTEITTTEMPKTTETSEICSNNFNQLQAENEILSMRDKQNKNKIEDIKNTTSQCFGNIFNVANQLETYSIYNETLPLYKYLYTAQEYIFGPENYLSMSMKLQYGINCNLVYLYDEGYAVISDVLQTRRRVLGELHPDTLKTMYYLADNLSLLGFYSDAEDMYKYVLEKQSEILGDLHPDTETTKVELIILSHHNGNLP